MNIKSSITRKSLLKAKLPKNNKLIKITAKKSAQLKQLVSQLVNCCDE